jgi:hypothetical protein
MSYDEFLAKKHYAAPSSGFEPKRLPECMFDFQRDVVTWACRRGKAALFLDTGLGKTLQSLAWAQQVVRHSGGRVLILAPLAVAQQTVREGEKFGIGVHYARSQDAADGHAIVATNYEMLHAFDVESWHGVVIDESSILKAFDGKARTQIIESFRCTPYRLACTATPAPNDFMELGNHSEFLGIMSRAEMLAQFFVHDGGETQTWRLKGHAEADFWRWVCSWAVLMRSPADLGYEAGGYELPPLNVEQHIVPADHSDAHKAGLLFKLDARTLDEQRKARRASIEGRVKAIAEMVNGNDRPWLVWCELNDEGDALEDAIVGAVQVAGADDRETKERRIIDFTEGRTRVLVSKPSICGFGMNWQHCADVAFCGISHSWESFYQAVRRCYRFGQTKPVNVHVVVSELEAPVLANLMRKEGDAKVMSDQMSARTRDAVQANSKSASRELRKYEPTVPMSVPSWIEGGPL